MLTYISSKKIRLSLQNKQEFLQHILMLDAHRLAFRDFIRIQFFLANKLFSIQIQQ